MGAKLENLGLPVPKYGNLPIAVHTIYCDGSCNPNPSPGGGAWGFVVRHGYHVLSEGSGRVGGYATNNLMEYYAILHAAKWVNENLKGGEKVIIRSDSQFAIMTLCGYWELKKDDLTEIYRCIKALLKGYKAFFEWVPREENYAAHLLANGARMRRKR